MAQPVCVTPTPLPRLHARPTATNALWGHILRKTGSSQVPHSTATSTSTFGKHTPTIAPVDKAGASTRILLHDTQAHLERFTDRVAELVTDLDSVKHEIVGVQNLYAEDHEQLMDKMIGLANRSQIELQKSIGSPAQSPQVRDLAKDMTHLSSRVDALEKKVESLNVLNQTQLQVMQTIRDQQGQILTSISPLLSLLQAVPLHVENARNHVKDAVVDLRQEILSRMAATRTSAAGNTNAVPVVSRASPATISGVSPSGESGLGQQRKKRRLESSLERQDSGGTSRRERPHDIPPPHFSARLSTTKVSQNLTSPDVPLAKRPSRALSRTLQSLPVDQQPPPKPAGGSPADSAARTVPRSTFLSQAAPLRTSRVVPPLFSTPKHDQHGRNDAPSTLHSGNPLRGPNPLLRPTKIVSSSGPASDVYDSPSRGNERSTSSANQPNSTSAVDHELPAVPNRSPAIKIRTPANQYRASSGSLAPSCDVPLGTPRIDTTSAGAHLSDMPPPSVGKPMSLKDRRAMVVDDPQNMGGKRFIPLDDDDDDDMDALAMM